MQHNLWHLADVCLSQRRGMNKQTNTQRQLHKYRTERAVGYIHSCHHLLWARYTFSYMSWSRSDITCALSEDSLPYCYYPIILIMYPFLAWVKSARIVLKREGENEHTYCSFRHLYTKTWIGRNRKIKLPTNAFQSKLYSIQLTSEEQEDKPMANRCPPESKRTQTPQHESALPRKQFGAVWRLSVHAAAKKHDILCIQTC